MRLSRCFDLFTLLIANFFAIAVFAYWGGSIIQVLWIYWFQGVVLGAIHTMRIITTRKEVNGGLPGMQNAGFRFKKSIQESTLTSRNMIYAGYFAFSYGIYHFFYWFVLLHLSNSNALLEVNGEMMEFNLVSGGISMWLVVANGLLFGVHHLLSYIHAEKSEDDNKTIVDFSQPYKRILPMHIFMALTLFVVSFYDSTFLVFILIMVIKTAIDIGLFEMKISHNLKNVKIAGISLY